MSEIGFVGLGHMGKPMAMNLHKCGAELMVYDVRTRLLPAFEACGIEIASCLADIAANDIIFLSLLDTEKVKETVLDDAGLFPHLRPGTIICDLSTINYTDSIEIANTLEKLGVEFVDAPVTGMEARAIDATLTVMCGGKQETYETLLPYIRYIGNNILYMGASGCGQLSKAINNILFDINMAALAEMLPVAVKLGLNSETIGSVINTGSGRSYASEFFIPRILKNHFSDGYPLKHAYKDLVCGAEMSAQLCIPLPLMHAATTTYQMALLNGLGDKDKGAMICVFEELLGVKFRK